jgi:hypothetical protein
MLWEPILNFVINQGELQSEKNRFIFNIECIYESDIFY